MPALFPGQEICNDRPSSNWPRTCSFSPAQTLTRSLTFRHWKVDYAVGMRKFLILSFSVGFLGACQPKLDNIDYDAVNSGTACGADRLRHLVGTPLTDLDQATLPNGTRVLGPGVDVPPDIVPTRLNLSYGTEDEIAAVYCG